MKKTINLHIVRNSVIHDSRVLRETAAIVEANMFDALEIAGFEQVGVPERESLGNRHIWRVPIGTRQLPKDMFSLSLKFLEWRLRIVSAYKRAPLAAIHCHDLEPLPIAVRLKKLTGAKIVYDAHELETERAGSVGAIGLAQQIAERRCMPSVDAMITVSPSIQKWYREKYPGMAVALVRNVPVAPENVSPVDLRGQLDVPEKSLLFIYQGGHVPHRGIELMLEVFDDPTVIHHILFMGSGPLASKVQRVSATARNIHWSPPVSPSEVLNFTAGADVGLSLPEDVSLNHRYCLPNKLFEYWSAGIPVVVSATPDQMGLVERYRAGWIAPAAESALRDLLRSLNRNDLQAIRPGVEAAREDLRWDREKEQLLEVYRSILGLKENGGNGCRIVSGDFS